MKKNITALTLVLLMCLGVFAGCTDKDPEAGPRARIKNLTEIEVPPDSEMVFHYQEEVFFPVPGRRAQYTVFEFENEPSEWLNENGFSDGTGSDVKTSFSLSAGYQVIENHAIPNEYSPAFDQPHLWLIQHNVFLLYFPNDLMLIVYVVPS